MRRKKCRTGAPVIAPAYDHVRVKAELATIKQKKGGNTRKRPFQIMVWFEKDAFISRWSRNLS